MSIYFDCAATTAVSDLAVQKAIQMMQTSYANPSSSHSFGLQADQEICAAKNAVARLLHVPSACVRFTSGGTEANNMALFGAVKKNSTILTTRMEHPSVYEPVIRLQEKGHTVIFLPVDQNGQVLLPELEKALQQSDTPALISMMHVNNETGMIQDIAAIGQIIDRYRAKRKLIFHSDCVQSFGKLSIPVQALDILTFSGHKINAPKGVGGFMLKSGVALTPLLYGGGQEAKLRPGTQNVPAIAALGAVCDALTMEENERFVRSFKRMLLAALTQRRIRFLLAAEEDKVSPYICNICFLDCPARGETIVHALASRGIFISNTSACNSKKAADNRVLTAVGYDQALAARFVRLSFDKNCQTEQLQVFGTTVEEIIKDLS